ncbi:ABC transporter substrate-binding protein [Ruicaihuangia caeni]|uniref:ABC transporter substrate-binding protein n=1 Tax=Ruicaihuangia caeni TaxID=3042517 RepID=UPI003390479E
MTQRRTGAARRAAAGAASFLIAVAALVGCTPQERLVDGSTVVVELPDRLSSVNAGTGHGSTPANLAVAAATGGAFAIALPDGTIERDESFGRMEIVSDDPFAVRYVLDERATWSDGVPVTAADLLLEWAANSGAVNERGLDRADAIDSESGEPLPGLEDDAVFFDPAPNSPLRQASRTPQLVDDDDRAFTLIWDEPFADWEFALAPSVPAHVVAHLALDAEIATTDAAAAAAQRVADAILAVAAPAVAEPPADDSDASGASDASDASDDDVAGKRGTDDASAELASIARAWNTGFDLRGDGGTSDADPIFVSSGPYRVSSVSGGVATLVANREYRGDRRPGVETIELRAAGDPLESVHALGAGEVDVIAPAPSREILDALDALDGVEVVTGLDGMFEHLDFRFAKSRNGDIERPELRRAILSLLSSKSLLDAKDSGAPPGAVQRDSFVLAPGQRGYDAAVDGTAEARPEPQKASRVKRELADAGIVDPELCVLFDPANPRRSAEFEHVRATLSPAGIRVTDCSDPDWIEVIGDPGVWDAALFGWRATNPGVTGLSTRLHSTEGASNFSYYADDEVDRLLGELHAATDDGDRRDLLVAIDERLWDDAYGVPLYQYPALVAHTDAVSGVTPSPLPQGLLWNAWQWMPGSAR